MCDTCRERAGRFGWEQRVDREVRVDDSWETLEGFECTSCGAVARRHPQTMDIWGCLRCGTTTAAVSTFFKPDVHLKEKMAQDFRDTELQQ